MELNNVMLVSIYPQYVIINLDVASNREVLEETLTKIIWAFAYYHPNMQGDNKTV